MAIELTPLVTGQRMFPIDWLHMEIWPLQVPPRYIQSANGHFEQAGPYFTIEVQLYTLSSTLAALTAFIKNLLSFRLHLKTLF